MQTPKEVRVRILRLFLVLLFFLFATHLRLGWIQLVKGGEYREQATSGRLRELALLPQRGEILDRNGQVLAVSLESEALYIRPGRVGDKAETAAALAQLLPLSTQEIARRLDLRSDSVLLSWRVSEGAAAQIREMAIPGVFFLPQVQRYYPQGSLAAHLLGFTGQDHKGLEGLEFFYEKALGGTPGRVVTERAPGNRWVPSTARTHVAAVDGQRLMLTIDQLLQHLVERELAEALRTTKAQKGVFILMQPHSGEILAMATAPGYDPNFFQQTTSAQRRNTAIVDLFEPGSTFKIITAAAVLEEAKISPGTLVDDRGGYRVGDALIRCWRPGGHGVQTFTQALQNSCNPVFAKLSWEGLGSDTFSRYLRAFGFGSPTGVGFPGEPAGLLPSPIRPNPVAWATVGFGQGIAVTPLQLAQGVAAIANGGYLVQPNLIRQIGGESTQPQAIRQVVSTETAATLTGMLTLGPDHPASTPGYVVAGKTGTAQIPIPGGYDPEKVIASFIGYAPAHDPVLLGLVILWEPDGQGQAVFGSTVAAPVFRKVMSQALQIMRVPATPLPVSPAPAKAGVNIQPNGRIPNFQGMTIRRAAEVAAAHGLRMVVQGSGTAISQSPAPGQPIREGEPVHVVFAVGGP